MWTPEDRAIVHAITIERAERCPDCNLHPDQWKDEPHLWQVGGRICIPCEKRQLAMRDDARDTKQLGMLYWLERVDPNTPPTIPKNISLS